ncbi:MAG: phage tail tube protein [Oenococcus sp.]|uniref:phage tail tube protein n=1 Tax=Oenococcus sp. TaxID=1979414 RepID=UPI0039EB4B4B
MRIINLQRFAAVDASVGLAATGAKMEMSVDGTTYTEVAGVNTIPDIGQAPETIDVTSLSDTKRKSVAGIANAQNLAFGVIYKGTNFSSLIAKDGDGVQYSWRITYPDGMTVTFKGSFALTIQNLAVNGAVTFTITVVVSDGPNYTPAPAEP